MKNLIKSVFAVLAIFMLAGTATATDTIRQSNDFDDDQWQERVLRFTVKHEQEEL
ncbi:hypothetical protein [Amphritea sp. HPY]|uniref:hypothetical protein n=1 Tax=Amphritea sp. HPY TaxID=3421652 RepID=UPI003D7C6B77